jgi:hypothetical protein
MIQRTYLASVLGRDGHEESQKNGSRKLHGDKEDILIHEDKIRVRAFGGK